MHCVWIEKITGETPHSLSLEDLNQNKLIFYVAG